MKILSSNLIKNHSLFDKTLFLTLIPLIGYGITYIYQYAYFLYFNISSDLIKIDLENIIFVSLGLIIVFFYSYTPLFYYLIYKIDDRNKRKKIRSKFNTFVILNSIISSLLVVIIWIQQKFSLNIKIFTTIYICSVLILLFVFKSNLSIIINKFEANLKKYILSPFVLFNSITLGLISILFLSSFAFGWFFASTKHGFYVYKEDSKQYIVPIIQKDRFIGLEFDKNDYIKNNIIIRNNNPQEFELKSIRVKWQKNK